MVVYWFEFDYILISFSMLDAGYLDNNSYKVMQLTAWIPLLDADEFNGCMEVFYSNIDKRKQFGVHQKINSPFITYFKRFKIGRTRFNGD